MELFIREDAADFYEALVQKSEKKLQIMTKLLWLKLNMENEDLHIDLNLYKEPMGMGSKEIGVIIDSFDSQLKDLADSVIKELSETISGTLDLKWKDKYFLYNTKEYEMLIRPFGYVNCNIKKDGARIGTQGIFLKEFKDFGLENEDQLQSLSLQ